MYLAFWKKRALFDPMTGHKNPAILCQCIVGAKERWAQKVKEITKICLFSLPLAFMMKEMKIGDSPESRASGLGLEGYLIGGIFALATMAEFTAVDQNPLFARFVYLIKNCSHQDIVRLKLCLA